MFHCLDCSLSVTMFAKTLPPYNRLEPAFSVLKVNGIGFTRPDSAE